MDVSQSTRRQSRRSRERVDYKALQEGPPLERRDSDSKLTWSTKELFRLTIIDNKVNADGECFVKVHYTGWHSKFDEWRPASDIVDIPQCYLVSSPEAGILFHENLKIAIKEALHCQRKTDAYSIVRIPIVKDLFDNIRETGVVKRKNRFLIQPLSCFNKFLGEKWFIRTINEAGDFAYVIKGTAEFWITERAPLVEYVDGQSIHRHRGFVFNLCFVKDKGNIFDFDEIMTELNSE